MTCPLCDQLLRRKEPGDPSFVVELRESAVFLSSNQGCPGWCVLVLKEHAEHLAEMPIARQARLFEEVAMVAGAVRAVSHARRVNYECLGNQVAHVHWHVIPRHANDPDPRNPVWGWPSEQLRGSMNEEGRALLIRSLRAALSA
jgi:diadenosine tetraphosphate (Ap4A) HIT family hydrolase